MSHPRAWPVCVPRLNRRQWPTLQKHPSQSLTCDGGMRVVRCRRALAALVVQQWRWFSCSRKQLRLADGLHRRRLMAAGEGGLHTGCRQPSWLPLG